MKGDSHMIKYIKGDLFSSPAQVLVNTVNLDGVMGKGIALQFKKLYPDMFAKYQIFCEKKLLDIGKLMLYKSDNKWILNFPTKKHWRNPSTLDYIEAGLQKFVETYKDKNITSIAFPKLGCGNGGLDWNVVKPVMDEYLKNLPIDIYVYEDTFESGKEFKNISEMKKWLMKYPKDLSFIEFKADLNEIAEVNEVNISFLDDEIISEFWFNLKNSAFLTRNDDKQDDCILYDLSAKLDYVVPCQISDGLTGTVKSALQLRLPVEGDEPWQQQMSI